MKNYREEMDRILKNGRILNEEEIKNVDGGSNGYWPVLEEGEGEYECVNGGHSSIFHYAVEDFNGLIRIHITGYCSKCGCYNDYVIMDI